MENMHGWIIRQSLTLNPVDLEIKVGAGPMHNGGGATLLAYEGDPRDPLLCVSLTLPEVDRLIDTLIDVLTVQKYPRPGNVGELLGVETVTVPLPKAKVSRAGRLEPVDLRGPSDLERRGRMARERRKELGLKQAATAALAGVSQMVVSRLENGLYARPWRGQSAQLWLFLFPPCPEGEEAGPNCSCPACLASDSKGLIGWDSWDAWEKAEGGGS